MITANTINLGIIGDPIEHSFSPRMHNFIASETGMDYVYTAFRVSSAELGEAIAGVRALGIRGINVTAPHKIAVMQYLDEISPRAEQLGAVNTVVNRDGRLCGYNTDSEGFYTALTNAGISVEGSRILVSGAGGVVKQTLLRIVEAETESITLVNRTRAKAWVMAEMIHDMTGFGIYTDVGEPDFDIVINTTSAGMAPQLDVLPTSNIIEIDDLDFIHSGTAAVDMIYNPSETLFLKEAKARGAKTLNGLDMLIYQGIIAYELFTETKLPSDMAGRIRKEVFSQ
ncbi:MAG: shikimate dehydrogenase [Clostridia bacterium]|nr:shikimate dehydrogenase [Clostridia bacterium]